LWQNAEGAKSKKKDGDQLWHKKRVTSYGKGVRGLKHWGRGRFKNTDAGGFGEKPKGVWAQKRAKQEHFTMEFLRNHYNSKWETFIDNREKRGTVPESRKTNKKKKDW